MASMTQREFCMTDDHEALCEVVEKQRVMLLQDLEAIMEHGRRLDVLEGQKGKQREYTDEDGYRWVRCEVRGQGKTERRHNG